VFKESRNSIVNVTF